MTPAITSESDLRRIQLQAEEGYQISNIPLFPKNSVIGYEERRCTHCRKVMKRVARVAEWILIPSALLVGAGILIAIETGDLRPGLSSIIALALINGSLAYLFLKWCSVRHLWKKESDRAAYNCACKSLCETAHRRCCCPVKKDYVYFSDSSSSDYD